MWLARLKHAAWSVAVATATLVFVVEEWLWDNLLGAMRSLGRLPGVRVLEAWIARLPPAGAAFFFLLPTTLLLPVKLIALREIAHGRFLLGAAVILAAKLFATALFARIYVLTQPALMRVRWFVALRGLVLRWRNWAYAQIEAHPLWRAMRAQVLLWRSTRAARWGRRWRALRRWGRMRRSGG